MGFFSDVFKPFSEVGDFVGDTFGALTGKTAGEAAKKGANAANDAARLYADRQEEANTGGLARAYQMIFGDDWMSKLGPGLNQRQIGMVGQFGQQPGGAGGSPQGSLGGGLLSQYGQLSGAATQDYGRLGQAYQQAMNRYDPTATAAAYAGNRESQIRQDSDRDLQGRNAMTRAALAGSGFTGSTTLANQMAGNADDVTRARDRSITDLGMASTDRMMSAQNAMRADALGGVGMQERGAGVRRGYDQMPLEIQRQLAFAAMNPGQVLPPTAGLSPSGSAQYAQSQSLQNLIGTLGPLAFLAFA